MPALDEYFDGLDESTRAAFERIRFLAVDAAPDAEQGTSYGMPALKYAGRPLLGFRVAKEHLSIFPFSAAVVDAVRDRLPGFELSKGTIRFTAEAALPADVVRDLVGLRMAEIESGSS
jgi:uncharacterized protein YdhG (YjbR/CyaY superfamily)